MITFPENLTATEYPGYFWDTKQEKLYSIKIDGVLKPLKRKSIWDIRRYCPFNRIDADNWVYQVSVHGKKRYLTDKKLKSLTLKDSVIPVK